MNRRDFLTYSAGLLIVPEISWGQTAAIPFDSNIQSQLQTLAKNYLSDHHEIPALYAFIAKDGRIIASITDGTSDKNKTRPAMPDDQLRIGSNSKAITATLIAILIDKNILSWNTKVEDAFPDLAIKYPRNKGLQAAIWQLLCHHGGINSHDVFDPALKNLNGIEWHKRYLDLAISDPNNPGPGDKNIYGPGYPIAVAIAEKLSGKSFESLMSEHLCRPLGITSFCMGHGTKTPTGWWYREKDKMAFPSPDNCNSYIINDPAGGICLSMADMAKIHSLRAGVRFRGQDGISVGISPATRESMNTAPWAALDGSAMGIWYETDIGVKWLAHAGNTGCGDWSRISILRDGTTMCFYHVNYNRPGDDPLPAFEWKDFSENLRGLTMQASKQ